MKKIFIYFLITTLAFAGCKDVQNKLKKDIKKADSLANVAVDSISLQIKSITDSSQNVTTDNTNKQPEETKYNKNLLISVYTTTLYGFSKLDTSVLSQITYFPDSVIVIKSQGIFQILDIEPVKQVLEPNYQVDNKAWKCVPEFTSFPAVTDTGWAKQGCFAQAVQNFSTFTAVLDVEKEANLPVNPLLEKKVKSIEPSVVYKVLNTYLGWTFFYAYKNNNYYLVGIDLNQF